MYGFIHDVLANKGGQVFTTTPRMNVRDAVRTMNEHGVGALLVCEGNRVAGIFTERDVLRRVVDEGRAPGLTLVGQVMTRDVVCVPPMLGVSDAMAMMLERRFRHLPVVDSEGVIGMVSIGDLLRRVSRAQEQEIGQLVEYIVGPR
ncbi:MAG: CBS domain-containing protein [Dehalococcoidia bacterium]|nr:CBS domain-containing protein [Dehalococcoidia bacterium]